MDKLRMVYVGVAVLVVGCADGNGTHMLTAPSSRPDLAIQAPISAAQPTQTSGTFEANVDFSTVTLTPKGQNCLLTVQGQLVFHGTIEGTANGTTSALEFGPCSEVAVNPPGTFADVFQFEGDFVGTVAGQPAQSTVRYMGRVAVGGTIDGRFEFSNGLAGELDVTARVAVGGEYQGQIVVTR
jgi:hypothetical protein